MNRYTQGTQYAHGSKKILLTICARGGSKGVPGKNIKLIAGKPLIWYTITVAKAWGKAKRIVCSTDSTEIQKTAQSFGIEIPFTRPTHLASDTAGKIEVLRHALVTCESLYQEEYDVVVDLDVTSPLRTVEDLDTCLKLFHEKNPDVLFSVTPARRNPYFNMVERTPEGFVRICKEFQTPLLRRQDAPEVYDMNASIYFYTRDFLMNSKYTTPLSSPKAAVYVMKEFTACDIDSEADFQQMEFLIKNKVVSYEY